MDSLRQLGQGIVFPFQLDNGAIVLSSYRDICMASIENILAWVVGDKMFNPSFGNYLNSLIGEPNDAVLKALVKRFILEALTNWEPRITILDIAITKREVDHLVTNIKFEIKATSEVISDYEYKFYV